MPRKRSRKHVIRDAAQLACVASPVRHQILRTLSATGPCSVKELASRLGRTAGSLYYHVQALEEVGLLFLLETRVVGQRHEAVYEVIADRIFTDPTSTSEEYIAAMKKSASPLLRLADRQVQAAFEEQRREGCPRPRELRIQQVNARLSRRAIDKLNRMLDEVLEFVHENDRDSVETMVSVTLAVAPIVTKPGK